MRRIEQILKDVELPPGVEVEMREDLPVPQAGLGALGELGRLLLAIYRARERSGGPREVATPLRKLLLIAAADHGVARRSVSRYPQATTAELVRDVLAGRAAVARLAPGLRVRAVVADFGVAGDAGDAAGESSGWAEFESVRVGPGTEDITKKPAMSRETAIECVSAGAALLERSCKGWDVDLVGTGDLGLGSTTSACALAAVLTGLPVGSLCGSASRGELVREALDRASPDPDDAVGMLAEYGGLETGALAGACLAAAARRIPILLDGVVSTAAAALAVKLAPGVRGYLIASHAAAIPAHAALLDHLGLVPLLRLGLDLGEGVGAVLAAGLVESAWELARPSAEQTGGG